jgi:hypothetical protein
VIAAQGKQGSHKESKVSPCGSLPYSSDDACLVLGGSISLSEEQEKKGSSLSRLVYREPYGEVTHIELFVSPVDRNSHGKITSLSKTF